MAGAITDAMERNQLIDELYLEAMEHMRQGYRCIQRANGLRNNVPPPEPTPIRPRRPRAA